MENNTLIMCLLGFVFAIFLIIVGIYRMTESKDQSKEEKNYTPQFQYLSDIAQAPDSYRKEPQKHVEKPFGVMLIETDKLARLPVMITTATKTMRPDMFCCKNSLALCDTAIIASFLGGVIIQISFSDTQKAVQLARRFVLSSKARIISENWVTKEEFEEIYDSRLGLYDDVFLEKKPLDEKLKTLAFEFGQILLRDCYTEKFEPYDKNSPLLIVGIEEQITCETDAQNFISSYINVFMEGIDECYYS